MRKFFPVVLSGLMAVSFSQLAAAQNVGVQGSAGTGANVDLDKGGTTVSPDVQNNPQPGARNQANQPQGTDEQAQNESSASSGASDDKNPDSPGKGWAKGHERGKGNPHGSASGGLSHDGQSDSQKEKEDKND